MPLTLEVVGQKAARMGAHARKTFTAGGTIGRDADNDWEFPDEYISGHHAKITLAAGLFTITDTSTNGVFINSPQNRLTRGQPYTLHDGDTVYIDDYEVRVTLGVDASFAAAATPTQSMDDSFDEPAGVDDTDPLKLLGLGSRPVSRGPTAEGLGSKSALSQNFKPPPSPPQSIDEPTPSATPGAKRIIPQGYNPFAAKKTAPGPDQQPRQNTNRSEDPDFSSTPVVNPLAVVRARPAESPREARASPPPETHTPPPLQGKMSTSSSVQPAQAASAARAAASGSDMDFAALLAAAGIDSIQPTPELAQQFGQILRTVVAGLMDVLRARDTIKNEFRMRMTTFKQADNNPLKYSANVEDALFNLLVKRNPAYLGPVDAFEDAFQDVRSHQMSMLAGMRVAYDSMLAAFDPAHLQEEFDRQGKSGSFLNSAKAKYWELYANKFRDMGKDGDATFRKLFGDEFAKAYEEQLARLRTQKRSEPVRP